MKNSPAFQLYPADFISDPDLLEWDMEMIGAYFWMICYLWLNGGKIENNSRKIAKILKFSTNKSRRIWGNIKEKFEFSGGYITHKRVTKEMQRQETQRLMKSKAGKEGARKKWQCHSEGYSSSSSSSSSSSVNNTNNLNTKGIYNNIAGAIPQTANNDTQKVIDYWCDKNNLMPINITQRDRDHWDTAVKVYGVKICKQYIDKIKNSKAGFITNQIDSDSADGKLQDTSFGDEVKKITEARKKIEKELRT